MISITMDFIVENKEKYYFQNDTNFQILSKIPKIHLNKWV